MNLEFQEEYKRLDRLCKDYLSSAEGVSEYIRQMESTSWSNRRYVITWADDYQQLKHVRWVRNQLAHEVGTLNSDICTEDDLDWVKRFYNRIINGSDPFTVIRKAKEEETRRAKQQRAKQKEQTRKATVANYPDPTQYDSTQYDSTQYDSTQHSPSFWDKLIAIIKKSFHKR